VVGQHRSTQRHGGKVVDLEEAKLRHRLREIAAEHIRWGRRMAYRLLQREGWLVNHKRVHRLWREEGLQRPTPRKQKRARPADGSVRRHQAEHPHQVWALDFQFDATADERRLKFLNVIDEHSRLCLAIRVGRRCKAKGRGGGAGRADRPLPGTGVHPQRQRARIHCPRPQTLGRKQHHDSGLYRTRLAMGERFCRIVQQPLPG
jgi:hypothetical protein